MSDEKQFDLPMTCLSTRYDDDRPTEAIPLARGTDPQESHDAAAEIAPRLGELQADVRELVRIYPGRTVSELSMIDHDRDPRRIGRRMVELERLGLIHRGEARICKVTGYRAATWTL